MKPISTYFDTRNEVKEKIAWLPVVADSGKRIWFKKYIRVQRFYSGLAGEMPIVISTKIFTFDEYVLHCLRGET